MTKTANPGMSAGRGLRTLRKIISYCVGVLVLLMASAAGVSAQVHPQEPAVNLGETSFLDALGGPGFMAEEIGDANHSGVVKDGSGRPIEGASGSNSISGLSHLVWQSNYRIFHASYAVEVLGVAAHVNAGTQGSAGGWGDMTVSPFILQWGQQTIGKVRIDQRFTLDFDLPVGEYHRESSVNLSSHAFTVHPYYAITVRPGRHFETSWRVHYLWNSTNNAPPLATGAQSTQAGQAIHFNATVGYALPHGFWVGPNGYFLKQVSAPAINGVRLRNSPEQVGAIGPGVMWDRGRCVFYANAYHEIGAENRPQGNALVLRVQWLFGKH
jgi:hypothetical protein